MKVSNGRQLLLEQVSPAAEPTVEIPAFPLVRDPLLLSLLSLSVLLLVIITIISSGNPQKEKTHAVFPGPPPDLRATLAMSQEDRDDKVFRV